MVIRVAMAQGKRNLIINFSIQGKHKEFNKNAGHLDKAGKINNFKV